MEIIVKMLLTALAVFIIANILPGVYIASFNDALIAALVLGVLKIFIRPIIIFFTLPITIVTLGLFLLVINTFIIMLTDYFVAGFIVMGFWTAFLFSLLLSLAQSVLYSFLKKENTNR